VNPTKTKGEQVLWVALRMKWRWARQNRCSDDTGPSLASHSELLQSLREPSGKQELLSHPQRAEATDCEAYFARLLRPCSVCSLPLAQHSLKRLGESRGLGAASEPPINDPAETEL
jgi:hypothetical protein